MITAQQAMDILRRLKQLEEDAEAQTDRLRSVLEHNAIATLSSRDMVAMTAASGLSGVLEMDETMGKVSLLEPARVAERAYAIADAMFEHKSKREGKTDA